MKRFYLFVGFVLSSLILFACTSKSPLEKEATAIINSKCNKCHSPKKIYQRRKQGTDRATWQKILSRMQNYGANLTEKEERILLDYLSGGK